MAGWPRPARSMTPDVRVTLIDRSNHHLFQPLLYQVATAALAAPDVSAPIRQLLSKQHNATVLMANVQRIDVERKRVLIDGRHLDYDYLMVATGHDARLLRPRRWAEHAPGLKTIGEALDIRRRILRAFEAAEMETSDEATPRLDDVRGHRRRSHRRRAGRGAGRDRGPHAGARLPALRSAQDPRGADRGGPARPLDLPRGALGEGPRASWNASASRCARTFARPISGPTSSRSATSASRPAPCCGRPACGRAR